MLWSCNGKPATEIFLCTFFAWAFGKLELLWKDLATRTKIPAARSLFLGWRHFKPAVTTSSDGTGEGVRGSAAPRAWCVSNVPGNVFVSLYTSYRISNRFSAFTLNAQRRGHGVATVSAWRLLTRFVWFFFS